MTQQREVKRETYQLKCNCGKKETILQLNFPLSFNYLPYFIEKGYKTKAAYGKGGVFYIENDDLIALGAVGNNRLQIKYKNRNSFNELDKLELAIKELPNDPKAKIKEL